MPSNNTTLSKNDLAILGAIFDPETSLSAKPHTQADIQPKKVGTVTHSIHDESVSFIEKAAIQHLNTANPSTEQIHAAISQLSDLIKKDPDYASAYVNRAQATRLLPESLNDHDLLSSILVDLRSAISIITTSPPQPNSTNDRILATAHSHRAYILLHASNNTTFFNVLRSLNLEQLGLPAASSVSQTGCEELASRDFAKAGQYGDEKARQMAVKTNPYAKLCGSIVKEALRDEIKSFFEGTAVATR